MPSLDALVESSHQVVAVMTRPDAPQGRGRTLRPSPVAARAEELGIQVFKPATTRAPELADRLRSIAPQCCPVVAYGALLPQELLDIPTQGWVNLHFSLLPRWRGAAPVQHAILAGDPLTGASTFRIVAALDAGAMFATVNETIEPTDTAGDLLHRLSLSGAELLVTTLDGIENGTLTPREQPDTGITLAPKISVDDARLRWTDPAVDLDRRIRGCTPSPGAWTTFRGNRFKISSATVAEESLRPGQLQITKRAVRVGTATTALELGEVQAQGKKPMVAADWARGITVEDPEFLGA